MVVAKPPFSACRDSDQYRATTMIATTMNAAISERALSNDLDRGFGASSGGMKLTQTQKIPCRKKFLMQGWKVGVSVSVPCQWYAHAI
jgi:hypothetical protein